MVIRWFPSLNAMANGNHAPLGTGARYELEILYAPLNAPLFDLFHNGCRYGTRYIELTGFLLSHVRHDYEILCNEFAVAS
jgi:hypothetical protein